MTRFKKVKLRNGLTLVLAPQPGALTATVVVLVRAGSEYESKHLNGLSHFLEHMVFKGTAKRPKPGQISEELDALGAEYNAFTGQQYTGYWAKTERHKLSHALELVSDLYVHPLFRAEEIAKERGVIIEEINMYEDHPARKVHDVFAELLYGDQPAGWSVAGKKEIIKKITRDDFIRYREARYVAPGTVVIVAGGFDSARAHKEATKLFGSLSRKAASRKPRVKEFQKKPALKLMHKKSDQTHLVMGVRAFPVSDQRRHALSVLSGVLGGGMSSRLFYRIREKMGAAYYVNADEELLLDRGVLSIVAGANHEKFEAVVKAILEECSRLSQVLVGAKELQKVKDHIEGSFIMGLETSDELAMFYGGQEIMTGTLRAPEEVLMRIKKVTAEEVRRLARTLFRDSSLNLAAIGPHKNRAALSRLLRFPK